MATDKNLLNIAVRHQVYLERVKAGKYRDFKTALKKLERSIIDLVTSLEQQKMSALTKKQLREVLGKIKIVQRQMLDKYITDLKPFFEQLYAYELGFEVRTLSQVIPGVSLVTPLSSASYRAALSQPISATGDLLEPFINSWKTKQVSAVDKLIKRGYSNGWTNQQMVQAIRGTKARGYKDGIIPKLGRGADATVRTATQHLSGSARMDVWQRNQDILDGYVIIATLDSETTPICRSLDKEVFRVGEGPVPPLHVGCRSTTQAKLKKEFNFLNEGATRSSAEGYVDSKFSYYEWLKTQSAEYQESAIGASRAKLLRKGGLSVDEFKKLNMGKNFEPLTLDEMRKLEPLAFEKAGI